MPPSRMRTANLYQRLRFPKTQKKLPIRATRRFTGFMIKPPEKSRQTSSALQTKPSMPAKTFCSSIRKTLGKRPDFRAALIRCEKSWFRSSETENVSINLRLSGKSQNTAQKKKALYGKRPNVSSTRTEFTSIFQRNSTMRKKIY